MLARMATPLQAQAALETAVVNALLAAPPAGLESPSAQCARMYNGQPPPKCGNVFLSVWYDGQRGTDNQRTKLTELFGVYITLTLRFVLPFDRWLRHRDDMEARMNAIKVLICQDTWNYSIINAANTLAGFRSSGTGDTTKPVGWAEALVFQGFDAIQEVGPDWFHARVEHATEKDVGIAQRIKFGMARRVQYIQTAT